MIVSRVSVCVCVCVCACVRAFVCDILHYCIHCTLHVGCYSKSLSESSGSEVYTDPLPRLGSKRSCSEESMGESSYATVEGMYMCARSLVAYHVCIEGTFMLYGCVQCDVHTFCPCYVHHTVYQTSTVVTLYTTLCIYHTVHYPVFGSAL